MTEELLRDTLRQRHEREIAWRVSNGEISGWEGATLLGIEYLDMEAIMFREGIPRSNPSEEAIKERRETVRRLFLRRAAPEGQE